MATKTNKQLNAKIKRLESKLNKQTAIPLNKNKVLAQRLKSIEWFKKKLNLTVVKQDFQLGLNTKNGVKQYDAVTFSNGRTAVFLGYGGLKYAWDTPKL